MKKRKLVFVIKRYNEAISKKGYNGKSKQCNKCHYIAKVKDSVCIILSEFEKLLDDGYKIEKIRPSEFNRFKNKQFRSHPHIISRRKEIYQRHRRRSTSIKTVYQKFAKNQHIKLNEI